MLDVLSFTASKRTVEPTSSALPLLRTLNACLKPALAFADAVHRQRSRWGVPTAIQELANSAEAMQLARRQPRLAQAWADLGPLVQEAFTRAAASGKVRHMARAMPDLGPRLARLGEHHIPCRHFAELLGVCDDEVITLLLPWERRGYRLRVNGIADLGQLHVLLADRFASIRPDPRLVDACRDEPVDPTCNVATARWQFYRPEALLNDGALPSGFAGTEHWLWESMPLNASMRYGGEHVLLAGPAVYPRQWLVGRRFAAVSGEVEVLKSLSPNDVTAWMVQFIGRSISTAQLRIAA